MKKIISAIFVFVALSSLIAFWTLKDFNQNLRSEVMTRLSEKTGRSIVVDGEIRTSFSLSPSVRLTDIRFANASWADNTYMAQIGSLEMRIGLMPLFRRKVEVTGISLKDVTIDLESDGKGQKNWIFPLNKGGSFAKKEACSVTADNISVENVELRFIDRQRDKTLSARIGMLTANLSADGIRIDSQWGKERETVSVKFNAGLKADRTAGQKAYDILMRIFGNGVTAEMKGTVVDPFTDLKMNAKLNLQADRASVFNDAFGLFVPALPNASVAAEIYAGENGLSMPFFKISAGTRETVSIEAEGNAASVSPLSARFKTQINAPDMRGIEGLPALPASQASGYVELNADGFSLDQLQMTVGESDLSGRIVVRKTPAVTVLAQLNSHQLHLSDILGKKYPSFVRQKNADLKAPDKKDKIFSSEVLPFGKLIAAKIDVDYAIDALTAADGTALGKVNVKAAMHDGVFGMPELKLSDYASFRAWFDASGQPAKLNAALNMNKLPLSFFFDQKSVKRGSVTGTIGVSGWGTSQAELASSLNGYMFVDARDIYISSFTLVSLPKELSLLNPFDEKQPVSVPCAVVNVPVINGVISSRNKIGLESSLLNMQVGGDVNLADETLKLTINAEPASKGILKSMFDSGSVSGTLTHPVVKLNTEKAIDNAMFLGMAFLAGGRQAAQEYMNQKKLGNVCQEALTAEGQ